MRPFLPTSLGVIAAIAAIATAAALASPSLPPDLMPRSRGAWGVDLSDQDRSVKPGDDFAMYQNGGWYARTQLGPGLANAAYWRDVRLLAPRRLGAILAELAADRSAPL